jgi:hypothetical protein
MGQVKPAFRAFVEKLDGLGKRKRTQWCMRSYCNTPRGRTGDGRLRGTYDQENTGLVDLLTLCRVLQDHEPTAAAAARQLETAVRTHLLKSFRNVTGFAKYRGITVFYHPGVTTRGIRDGKGGFLRDDTPNVVEGLAIGDYAALAIGKPDFEGGAGDTWRTIAFEQ